jgi:hypothetical protein
VPQSRSGQVRKISPPPGFDPQTVQPVGGRYTDYATRPTKNLFKMYVPAVTARYATQTARQSTVLTGLVIVAAMANVAVTNRVN